MTRSSSLVNICHLVINEHGPIFAEVIALLRDNLQALDLNVTVSVNEMRTNRINLLVGHLLFLPETMVGRILGFGQPYIVHQLEPLDDVEGYSSRYPLYFDLLRGAAQVWDYSRTNIQALRGPGFPEVRYIPIGHSAGLERIPHAPEDIDVLFYGGLTDRRRRVVEQLGAAGARVETLFNCYGAERDAFIARAKVVLNVHLFATRHLEQVRLSYLLNNRRFIVSEEGDCDPYPGGLAYAPYEELADRCLAYLQPGSEIDRCSIAETGYQALKRVPMREAMADALAALPALPEMANR